MCASCVPTTPVRQQQTALAGTLWCWSTGRRRQWSPACPPLRWKARSSATAPEMSPKGTVASLTSATTRPCTYTQVQPTRCYWPEAAVSICLYYFSVVFWSRNNTELYINSAQCGNAAVCGETTWPAGASLCAVCLCGFTPDTLASSQSPKICMLVSLSF